MNIDGHFRQSFKMAKEVLMRTSSKGGEKGAGWKDGRTEGKEKASKIERYDRDLKIRNRRLRRERRPRASRLQ